jgi:hypothetical protein
MGERSDEIEEQINRTRGELNENISELEDKVKSVLDWRAQFEEQPMVFLAVAFAGGALASTLLPAANGRRRRCFEEAAAINGNRKRTREGLDALKSALIAVAASKFGGALGEFLSTYRSELRRVRESRREC